MAHLELADGVFIEYTTSDLGGNLHCTKAQLDCTFDDAFQIKEALELIDELGLDDNVSLIAHVNDSLNQ